MKFGLWVDDPPRVVLDDKYIDDCLAMGVSEFAVMIDDAPKRWKPSWDLDEWEELCSIAHSVDIELSITSWPWPDKDAIKHMYLNDKDGIKLYMDIASQYQVLTGEESDTEWNWKFKNVLNFIANKLKGFSKFDVAGRFLSSMKLELAREFECRSESTVFPGHSEMTKNADVSIFMMMVFLQIYSVATRGSKGNKRKIPWDSRYGPGRMQKFGIEKAIQAGIDIKKLAAGLALWNQKWRGHTIREAFKTALYACMAYEIEHYRGWSSKWVVGVRKRQQMAEVLKDVMPALVGLE